MGVHGLTLYHLKSHLQAILAHHFLFDYSFTFLQRDHTYFAAEI